MSYETARNAAELTHLAPQIQKFATNYPGNPIGPDERRTIILFPGGLGSALMRAKTSYKAGGPVPKFDDFWVTVDLFFGGVNKVAMDGDVNSGERFVVPNAEVKILGVGPYNGFEQWCAKNNIDLFVFGYDWRRKPEFTIAFFFEKFLPALKGQVKVPISDITLVGHSLGGMLVKLIMNSPAYAQQVTRAITVGSPFYGYAGQTLRYFEGEKEFCLTGKKKTAEIIATLEGGYYLQFLDKATYDLYGPALASVSDYKLLAYPSLDPDGSIADPFNPIDTPKGVRYPKWVERAELGPARSTMQQIAAALPQDVAKNFFNIRGVQFENGVPRNNTSTAQTWSVVAPNFDPDTSPVPIDYASGPGDSTIPAWSSRLVGLETTNPDNVTTLVGDVEHMFLMELAETQARIFEILYGIPAASRTIPVKPPLGQVGPPIDIATSLQVRPFVQRLRNFETAAEAREYLERFQKTNTRANVERMARGILALLISGAARPSEGETDPGPAVKSRARARLKRGKRVKSQAAKSKSPTNSKRKTKTKSVQRRRPRRGTRL